jgi:hypothetical protein
MTKNRTAGEKREKLDRKGQCEEMLVLATVAKCKVELFCRVVRDDDRDGNVSELGEAVERNRLRPGAVCKQLGPCGSWSEARECECVVRSALLCFSKHDGN